MAGFGKPGIRPCNGRGGDFLNLVSKAVMGLARDLVPEECLKDVLSLLDKTAELASRAICRKQHETVAQHKVLQFSAKLQEFGKCAAECFEALLAVCQVALAGGRLRQLEEGLRNGGMMSSAPVGKYLTAIECELEIVQLRMDAFQRCDVQRAKREAMELAAEYEANASRVNNAWWLLTGTAVVSAVSFMTTLGLWHTLSKAKKLLAVPEACLTVVSGCSAAQFATLKKCFDEVRDLLLKVHGHLDFMQYKVNELKLQLTVCKARMSHVKPEAENLVHCNSNATDWSDLVDPLEKLKTSFEVLRSKTSNALSELQQTQQDFQQIVEEKKQKEL